MFCCMATGGPHYQSPLSDGSKSGCERRGSLARRGAELRAGRLAGRYLPTMGKVTEQLEAALRGLIESGERKEGEKMPSEREIVATYGAGRTTVRLVLAKLAAQGVIEPRHGSGYYVCAQGARDGKDS